jgi:hypothetical protein
VAAGWLYGCASAVPVVDFYDADAETLRRFPGIGIVHERQGFEDLGELRGLYCYRNSLDLPPHDPAARAAAIDQLRVKAAGRGADAISEPHCQVSVAIDMVNNCLGSVLCISHALRRDGLAKMNSIALH